MSVHRLEEGTCHRVYMEGKITVWWHHFFPSALHHPGSSIKVKGQACTSPFTC